MSTLTLMGAGPEAASGGTLPDPALPAVSTGTLQAQFKTNVGTSTTTDGVAVSQWNDQSGNLRHLVQATGANQPLYKAAILNGYPALRFDGVNDNLKIAFTLAQPDTWFMVLRWNAVYAANDVAIDGAAAALAHDHGRTSNTQVSLFNTGTVNLTPVTTTSFNYLTSQWNGASSLFRGNGGAVTASGNPGTGNAGGVTVGSDASGANVASIDVCELVVYSGALNATDYAAVELYLKNKYAL